MKKKNKIFALQHSSLYSFNHLEFLYLIICINLSFWFCWKQPGAWGALPSRLAQFFFGFWHSETINFQKRIHFPNVRGFFTSSTDYLDKKRSVPTFIKMIQCPIKEVGRCGDKGGEDIMRLLPTTGYLFLPHSHKHKFIFLYILLCQSHSCTHLYIYLCLYHQLSLYDYISCCHTVDKHTFIYIHIKYLPLTHS